MSATQIPVRMAPPASITWQVFTVTVQKDLQVTFMIYLIVAPVECHEELIIRFDL